MLIKSFLAILILLLIKGSAPSLLSLSKDGEGWGEVFVAKILDCYSSNIK